MANIDFSTAYSLILSIKSAIDSEKCEQLPDDLDLHSLFNWATFHKVESIVYSSLEKNKVVLDNKLNEEWIKKNRIEELKSSSQIYELKVLFDLFEKNSIKSIVLKGSLLKKLYPKSHFRQMGDIDFFYDKEKREECKALLEENEYVCTHYQPDVEIVFQKRPFIDLEMHEKMVYGDNLLEEYYQNPFLKAKNISGYNNIFEQSLEDFYIYLIVHFAKHFYKGGAGLRNILDVYLFLKEYNSQLDREYIDEQLKSLNLADFEKEAKTIANKWFVSGEVNLDNNTENYILNSGAFGTTDNVLVNELNKRSFSQKFKYIFSRIFVSSKYIKQVYGIDDKKSYLVPIYFLRRLFTIVPKKAIVVFKK